MDCEVIDFGMHFAWIAMAAKFAAIIEGLIYVT